MAPTLPGTFTTRQVLTHAHVTYRRLDYWCRVGVFDAIPDHHLTGRGSGAARQWTPDLVHALTVCGRIADTFTEDDPPRNVPTVVLAHAVAALARNHFPTDGVLLANGYDAEWTSDTARLIELLLHDGQPWLVLPLLPSDRPS